MLSAVRNSFPASTYVLFFHINATLPSFMSSDKILSESRIIVIEVGAAIEIRIVSQ